MDSFSVLQKMNLSDYVAPNQCKSKTAKAVLDYYQNRKKTNSMELFSFKDNLNFGIDGLYNISEKELADGAIENRFLGQISFGLVDCGTPIDWDYTPTEDPEWAWQFHRFRWLPALGKIYQKTADERYALAYNDEINSWVTAMHSTKREFAHPGWRSLDVALRLTNWATSFEFFIKSQSLTPETLIKFLYSLEKNCELIFNIYHEKTIEKPSNWNIYHLEGLLFAAITFPEFKKSELYIETAIKNLIILQNKVLLNDGVIEELIPGYHMAYPYQFSRVLKIKKAGLISVEIPEHFVELLKKSIDAVLIWSHPDGTCPLFGDSFKQMKNYTQSWLQPLAKEFDSQNWKFFSTNGKSGEIPTERLFYLPNSGYASMRSSWNQDSLFLVTKNSNCDPSPWHNHPDNLNFELSSKGEKLLISSGSYTYTQGPWRNHFSASSSHQTVTLDNKNNSQVGKFVYKNSFDNYDLLVLENQATPTLTHRRSFYMYKDKYVVILDQISGKDSGLLRQHFQFFPGESSIDKGKLTAKQIKNNKVNLLIKSAKCKSITLEEEDRWLSEVYNHKEQRPAFAFLQKKPANETRTYLTLIVPFPESDNYDIAFTENKNTGETEIIVKTGETSDILKIY